MKFIYLLISLLSAFLLACSTDHKLCECIEAGDVVNELSASFFNRPATQEGKDSLDAAIQFRDDICAPYQVMDVQSLHKAKEDCERLKLEKK